MGGWTRGSNTVAGRSLSRGVLACVVCLTVACGGGTSTGPGGELPDEVPGPSGNGPDLDPTTPQERPDAGVPDAGEPTPPDAGPPDAGSAPTVCAPTAGETRWLTEGQLVTATVTCSTGNTTTGLRFSVDNLPPGAAFDEATATLRWTPGRDQAAVWNLVLREHTSNETGILKVGVAENDGAPGNVKIVDPKTYTEEYGLPVFHLIYTPPLTSGSDKPAQLIYRGRTYNIEAKYRGATSGAFPKRSFTLEFPDEDLFNEPVFGDGFLKKKRVALVTTFNDNSYVRTRLAFDLWSKMSPEHIRVRTFSAVLYANNRYLGLYTAADLPHKRMMAENGMDKDSDLFKAVENDANFSRIRKNGEPKASLREGFEKKVGEPEMGQPHAWDTLEAFITFVADSDDATFRTGFPRRTRQRDYEDWWIFNSLILGTDSHSKNAYHAYDPKTQGPWRFIPWDLDASFGQNFDTTRTSPTTRSNFTGNNRIFARLLADPTFAGPMRQRYQALLRDELKLEAVLALIDTYEKETSAVAKRDWARWQLEYRAMGAPGTVGEGNFPAWYQRTDFLTYEEELAYVRQWVRTRWPVLQSQLP
ncbi:CotH kinase family protein [Myxococcus sp. AM011]|uniref:CotH kinase family protein n=1 Tax=Myxococcus sp. AM011 TaxID=2745200 RepID=UPI0015953ADE|nr:CotH kinase family protein [Myxococcus sp. AM011]NVJ20428.1 CotH kinase family protein [Myxococcus sp. AM011]